MLVELSAQNDLLRRQVAELSERVEKQDERIAELERRLSRNSRNSSVPPSQDPPGAPERKRPGPSGQEQGAQPGHPWHGRRLLRAEAVDEVVDHWPARCACGHRFGEQGREAVGEPARHQVSELPEIGVKLTEHRLHRQRCPECGRTTRAELPAELPAGAWAITACEAGFHGQVGIPGGRHSVGRCHRAFDEGRLDLLPHLEPRYRAELAHAFGHVSLLALLERVTGERWRALGGREAEDIDRVPRDQD